MRFYVKDYTSPDYASPEAAAVAATYYTGRHVEYDYRGEGFVSKGDIVQPAAAGSMPKVCVNDYVDEDLDEGDIW